MWAFAKIDSVLSTPPADFPAGTEIVQAPPASDDSLHVRPFAYDDPRSIAHAEAEASFTPATVSGDEVFSSFDLDVNADAAISDPVNAECGGTWTQAYGIEASGTEPVELRVEWSASASAFVSKFSEPKPLGESEVEFSIEGPEGVIATGTSAARRFSLISSEFEDLYDTTVTGDWSRLPGGGVEGEGIAPLVASPGEVVELTLAFRGRSFVPDGANGSTTAFTNVRFDLVPVDASAATVAALPVPEPAAGSAAGVALLALGTLARRRPGAPGAVRAAPVGDADLAEKLRALGYLE